MRKFLINTCLFLLIITASMLAVFFMADGTSDSYYARFTTPRQHSLIIGTSRAAQGVQPSVLNKIIYNGKTAGFYNYSFSLFDSPFGAAYLESIKRKLDTTGKDGIFIVCVDPWAISDTAYNPDDSLHFKENEKFIGETKYVNINPNIPYLIQSYAEPYINIIRKRKSSADLIVQVDGWLEVKVSMDSLAVAQRLVSKVKDYRENYLPKYKFSTARFNSLIETISFLQNYGKVYLVRLPAHPEILKIEDELMPGFDNKVDGIVKALHVNYLNFKLMENNYRYVDGNHLYQTSGKEVSQKIADWIVEKSK